MASRERHGNPLRASWWHAIGLLIALMFVTSCNALGVGLGTNTNMGPLTAPELKGGLGWLNTDKPITLKELRGKIVLLDFWTFCCINCMHVIPDLHKLEAKYPNELVVIGVHSAKFDNEKDSQNIRKAVLRYDIEHPVVNDANFEIWKAYGVHAWPTLVLINPDGRIEATASGEGNFEVLDQAIAGLVQKYHGRLNLQPLKLSLEKDKMAKPPLMFPGKIKIDESTKQLVISDSGHNRVVIADLNGKVRAVIGSGATGAQDGSFEKATFHHPQGAVGNGDKIYIADTENHLLRLADLKAGSVTTIAGIGKQSGFGADGGPALQTAISSPWDLVLAGNRLYVAMAGCHQLWCMDLAANTIAPYAGTGQENIVDGVLDQACLAQPSGLTTDGKHLYFADSEVSAVREADLPPGNEVSTIVGKGLFDFGDRDGSTSQALLQHPLGLAWHAGKLYVADSYNHRVKEIDPVAKTIHSIVGTGHPGSALGATAQLSEPAGVAVCGNTLYIADTNNNRILQVDLKSHEASELTLDNLHPPAANE